MTYRNIKLIKLNKTIKPNILYNFLSLKFYIFFMFRL